MNFPFAFIEGLGGPELMMILFVILLLFGANKLPELARGLGRATREFKKATSGVEEEIRSAMEEKPAPAEEAKRFAPKPAVAPPQNTTPSAAGNEPPARTFPPYPPGSTPPPAENEPKS